MNEPYREPAGERARLERQVNRLSVERGLLFEKSGASHGLSKADQQRLGAIERELDECFIERRRLRAGREMQRFGRDRPFDPRQSPTNPAP
jgi:hypothetical protein